MFLCWLPDWSAMNNTTSAEEHLLPQSKEEDKGERSCGDPDFDLMIFPYLITMEPRLMVKIPIVTRLSYYRRVSTMRQVLHMTLQMIAYMNLNEYLVLKYNELKLARNVS